MKLGALELGQKRTHACINGAPKLPKIEDSSTLLGISCLRSHQKGLETWQKTASLCLRMAPGHGRLIWFFPRERLEAIAVPQALARCTMRSAPSSVAVKLPVRNGAGVAALGSSVPVLRRDWGLPHFVPWPGRRRLCPDRSDGNGVVLVSRRRCLHRDDGGQ